MGLYMGLLSIGLASGLLTAHLWAQSAQASGDQSAILELERRLAAAWVSGDRAFIEGLLADDWTVIDQSGQVLTKRQVLDEAFASAERRVESMAIDEVQVRMLGDVAVATGLTRATGSYRGESATVTLRFTDVFVRRQGRWQVVASQGTTVAP